jgi:hypothetical protein
VLAFLLAVAAPQIDLLTFGDLGDTEPLARAGHSALCVSPDPATRGKPVCVSFGYAEFDHPAKLAVDYVLGRPGYWAELRSYPKLLQREIGHDRDVWRQVLPLSPDEASDVEKRVHAAVQPDVARYIYHHLDDNCATRIRDLIDAATHGRLHQGEDTPGVRPWREYGRDVFHGMPIALQAAELSGPSADHAPSGWELMAFPVYLRDGVQRRFGVVPEVLATRQGPPASGSRHAGQVLLVAVGVLGAVLGLGAAGGRRVGLVSGLIGLVLWMAWLVSPLPELRHNAILLLWCPLDLALLACPQPRLWQAGAARAGLIGVLMALSLIGLVQPLLAPGLAAGLPFLAVAAWPAIASRSVTPAAQ